MMSRKENKMDYNNHINKKDSLKMAIILDNQLQENIQTVHEGFPISFNRDELVKLPNWTGPMHWHNGFEIGTAINNALEFRVGTHRVKLNPGESIFINGNVLHSIKQTSGNEADPFYNIVFSASLIASENHMIFQKYIEPVLRSDNLPFVVFRNDSNSTLEINQIIQTIYNDMCCKTKCYEIRVLRNLSCFMEYLYCNIESFDQFVSTRVQIKNQIRMQKMLSFIYARYMEPVSLQDIANAADISRSEAGRCFTTYMGCSPIEALIRYRLEKARTLIRDKSLSMQEICFCCGFNSVSYFSRKFKEIYDTKPSDYQLLGK